MGNPSVKLAIGWLQLALVLLQLLFVATLAVADAVDAGQGETGRAAGEKGAGETGIAFLEHQLRAGGEVALEPRELVHLVVARNAETIYSHLQTLVAARMAAAERGIYDPIFFSSLIFQDTSQPPSEDWQHQLFGGPEEVEESSRTSESGVRYRLVTGAEVSLRHRYGGRESSLLPGEGREYNGTLTLSIEQPLLRGRGRDAVEADLQVAKLEHSITRQQYQQQVLITAGEALREYWQLYRALETRRIRALALENARRIHRDVQVRVDRGRSPRTDLLEARIAIASREVELTRAERAVTDARTRLKTFLNLSGPEYSELHLLTDVSPATGDQFGEPLTVRQQRAQDNWPGLRIAEFRRNQGEVRLRYAENQLWPDLDLVGSYNFYGRDEDASQAFRDSWENRFFGWQVGLNLEIPLGNRQARGQYGAQMIRVRQAALEIESIRSNLANDVEARWEQLMSAHREMKQIEQDVELREELHAVELLQYQGGRSPLWRVFEREDEVNESRYRKLESVVRLELARLALMLVDSSLLAEYAIQIMELE